MHFENSVYDGNFSAFDLEHDDFSDSDWLFSVVGQEQKVSSVKGRLHTSTKIIGKNVSILNIGDTCFGFMTLS